MLALGLSAAPAYGLDPAKPFSDFARDDWSAEQGLPQITVLAMAQGPDGYLWIGTQGGLARFDGIRFRNFTPDEVPELPGLWVQAMLVDKSGRLWIGTYKGLASYKEGRFTTVQGGIAATSDVRALAELPDGDIAAATSNGLGNVHDDVFTAAPGFTGLPVYGLLSHGGILYVGSVDKVYMQGAHGITAAPLPAGEHGVLVTHLLWHDGALWAGTSDGLFRYSGSAWSRFTLPAPLDSLPVSALRTDGDGTLWVATIAGLARVHPGRVTEVVPPAATDGQVESIYEDREHNLWFGTRANGLFRLWNGFIERLSTQYGLSNPVTWALAPAQGGGYWVGTSDGLDRYRDGHFQLAVTGTALPDPNAYTLLADGETLWIGTRNGLALYKGGRLQRPPPVFAPLTTVQISGILKTRGGDYWFATTGGAFRYAGGALTRFGPDQGLAEVRCRVLLETRDGRLLVGTDGGLYAYAQGRMSRVPGIPASADVPSISELRDGTLIAGSLTETALYVEHAGTWAQLGTAQGLLANIAFSIQEDRHGYVWIAGDRGIYRMPTRELEDVAVGRLATLHPQGVLSDQGQWPGSQVGHCCNGAGNARGLMDGDDLFLPSREGVVVVNTMKPVFNSVPPTTVVESIEYGGQWHPPAPGESPVLPAKDRDIAIRFTALSFQYPGGVMLRYRLLGYDDEWKSLPDPRQRTVFYTNLPPGHYMFEAQGANNAGVWSEDTADLPFDIRYHYYETWWFRTVAALLALTLVYALFRLQLRALRSRQLQLERTVQLRTAELREANTRLEEASQTDPLTGAKNRRYLANQLPADIAHFKREFHADPTRRMVFALMDLDHFKEINDGYGHAGGDRALVEFADLLKRAIRQGDYLVRWGGEEFLVILRSVQYDTVAGYAERLSKAVQRYRFATPDDRTLRLTCSLGFVEFPFYPGEPEALDWNQAIVLADRAMYSVKQGGRNGWAIVRPAAGVPPSRLIKHFGEGLPWLVEKGLLTLSSHLQGPPPKN